MLTAVDPQVRAAQLGLVGTGLLVGLLAGIDPKLALAAALGIAFVVLVVSDLAVGVAAFALLSFLDLLPVGGAALTFAKLAGLLLAVVWLARLAVRQDSETHLIASHPAFSYLLVLFVAWALISVLWAESPAAGFDSAYRYALNIGLFLIVFTAIRKREHVVWVTGAFLAGATISAMYGIAFPAPPASPDDISRLTGAGIEPNELAATLVAALALASAFAAGWRRAPLVRVLATGVIVLCAAGVLVSFSRGGLVALAVALLAALLVGGRWRWGAAVLLVLVSVSAVTYFSVYAKPEERERIVNVEGGTGRSDIWAVGWRMVEANPVRGVGAGNFEVSSIHYLLEPGALRRDEFIVDTPKVAHNVYLQVLAELGVIGLVLFLAILGFSLTCAFRAVRAFMRLGDRRMELLSRALIVALVGLLAADFFASEQFSKQLWLLLALGPSLLAIARASQRRELVGARPA